MPDIDMDFCYLRRGEVLEYAVRRYGQERVAQICTFGTLAARAAVRDVGRVMGMPYSEVDRVAEADSTGSGGEPHGGAPARVPSSTRRWRTTSRRGRSWR